MYRPENWRRLVREIVVRHRSTYEAHLVDAFADAGAQWADVRQWADDRERARAWWETQARTWQRRAEEGERLLDEQKRWIAELECGRAWREEHGGAGQRLAEEAGGALEAERAAPADGPAPPGEEQ